jgi:hypothetical protein
VQLQIVAGAENTDGDLAAVGRQYFGKFNGHKHTSLGGKCMDFSLIIAVIWPVCNGRKLRQTKISGNTMKNVSKISDLCRKNKSPREVDVCMVPLGICPQKWYNKVFFWVEVIPWN